MAKNSPGALNTRVIRIGIGDYALLKEVSQRAGVTFAEAFHLVITEQAKREAIVVPRSQIPMSVFRVTSVPTIAVNGNRRVTFKIKPKGGIIRG